MASPLLLVHDDLATIALVRRTLVRAGHTVELATSTADALASAMTQQPALVLLAPGVESGRGAALLHELASRPETRRLPVLLLGRMVDGHQGPVLPTPFRSETLLRAVDEALAAAAEATADVDEPLTDTFGTLPASPPPPAATPETLDLDWSLVEPGPEQPRAPGQVEAFDAGPLLEAEPEQEALPPAEPGEVLEAAEEPAPRLPDLSQELENTAPMLALAAGAWSATTDDRLSPLARPTSSASALLEDIASEARARDEEARVAREAVAEEQRLRKEAEDLSQARSREAREASQAAMAARIDAEEARAQAEAARAAQQAAESATTELQRVLEGERRRASEAQAAVEAARSTAAAEAELLAKALGEAESRVEIETNARLAAEARSQAEIDRLSRQLQAHGAELEQVRAGAEAQQALEREAAELAERLASEERASADARRQAEAWLQAEREAADALRRELVQVRTELRRVREELEQDRERLAEGEIRIAQQAAARAEAEEDARSAREEAALARAEAESVRQEAERRAREEEERRIATARAEAEAEAADAKRRASERARWAVADAGRVTLAELAALLFRLEEGRATARLELRAADALRVLWLEEGALASAATTVSTESLLDHGVRDGLVDQAAERELRILRLSETELTEELLRRKLLTEAELIPFLQRLTEARALEAFSEPVSFYRLSPDTPPPEGKRAAVRALSALAAEGVRRGLPPEEVDQLVPSLRGVPRLVRPLDAQALGLGDRERRLLEAMDGQRTVQQLLLALGIAQGPGRKAVAVAVALGWVELRPPSRDEAQAETVEVAAARLEARWAQVEDADYFTVLGLPRHAGTDEVARAFARLSAEYDPLRWSGHPDPRVQARAERMQALLSEAARALSDDTLRTAYARSLGE